jgi:hypothetical protein
MGRRLLMQLVQSVRLLQFWHFGAQAEHVETGKAVALKKPAGSQAEHCVGVGMRLVRQEVHPVMISEQSVQLPFEK